MDPAALIIDGKIVFREDILTFTNATAHIYLEDISYADAAAVTITETIIPYLSHKNEVETVIGFKLPIDKEQKLDSKADYGIRVWININSDGKVGSHDFFSDVDTRVLTQGYGSSAEIIFTRK